MTRNTLLLVCLMTFLTPTLSRAACDDRCGFVEISSYKGDPSRRVGIKMHFKMVHNWTASITGKAEYLLSDGGGKPIYPLYTLRLKTNRCQWEEFLAGAEESRDFPNSFYTLDDGSEGSSTGLARAKLLNMPVDAHVEIVRKNGDPRGARGIHITTQVSAAQLAKTAKNYGNNLATDFKKTNKDFMRDHNDYEPNPGEVFNLLDWADPYPTLIEIKKGSSEAIGPTIDKFFFPTIDRKRETVCVPGPCGGTVPNFVGPPLGQSIVLQHTVGQLAEKDWPKMEVPAIDGGERSFCATFEPPFLWDYSDFGC